VTTKILEACRKAGPQGCTVQELVAAVYGHLVGGGPTCAETVIYVTCKRLREEGRLQSSPAQTTYRLASNKRTSGLPSGLAGVAARVILLDEWSLPIISRND
jgi:hypothetical protein